jgi:ABC-type bacteriocin/lantibiotic exporter with double-glycine peptidase domain
VQNIGVKIKDLSFGYGRDHVLRDVGLRIEPNEVVGIVGESGCGKTTMVRLMLSLVEAQEGKIEFSGDFGAMEDASAEARRFISYVPQGNTLLSGTLEDNLRAGKEDVTPEQMRRALEIADCLSFVESLEEGVKTNIGENGLGLSEGQAQRIAIARAVLKDAPILILDEATSALDEDTEERVIRRMRESNLLHTGFQCWIIAPGPWKSRAERSGNCRLKTKKNPAKKEPYEQDAAFFYKTPRLLSGR